MDILTPRDRPAQIYLWRTENLGTLWDAKGVVAVVMVMKRVLRLGAVLAFACLGSCTGMELAPPAERLAARYSRMNQTLILWDDGSFRGITAGCFGAYSWNPGQYRVVDDVVILRSNDERRLLLVKWGERRYLIPEGEIVEFCNSVNQGFEPRDDLRGFHFLRHGDEAKPVSGFPKISEKWRAYLLEEPIRGNVVRVVDGTAVLDIGANDGLKVGMDLTALSPNKIDDARLKVISVEQGSARAVLKYEDYVVKAGYTVSTRLFDE